MKKIYRILCFVILPIICFSQTGTWSLKTHAPTFRHVNAVQILPSGRIIAVGGWLTNDAITSLYYSDDSATTWTIVHDWVNAMMNGLHFPTATTGYIVGNAGQLFKSIDAGQSWLPLTLSGNAGSRDYNGVYFTDANTGIAVGGKLTNDSIETIIKTIDGGQNWTVISDNLNSRLLNVRFIDANNGYAVGVLGKILKTTDGGTSWTQLAVPGSLATRQFHDIYFFDALTGVVVGGNPSNDSIQTIIKTTNGGITWSIISDELSPMLRAIYFYNNNEGYVTGDLGVIKYTNDQGNTWTTDTAASHDQYALNDVFFLNSNFGVASGQYGKTLVYQTSSINAPAATITTPVGIVNSNTAYIQGTLKANTISTSVEFEYGTSTAFGTLVPMSPSSTTNNNQAVSLTLTGLQPTSLYYGRVKVTNSSGSNHSATIQFSTSTTAIPNFDFELWNSLSIESLSNWTTAGNIQKVLSYDGSYAAKLQGNQHAPGGVGYGDMAHHVPIPFPYSGRPDSLVLYAKYDVDVNDSAVIFISFKSNGIYISSDTMKLFGSSSNLFQRIGMKINYRNLNTPDSLALLMISTDFFAGHNSQTSTLTIDNVLLTGGVPQLPNGNMENWFMEGRNQAVSWNSPDDITHWPLTDSSVVARSTDAFSGNYALLLRNSIHNGQFASISTGSANGTPAPSFPVNQLYQYLYGHLKFQQDNNDTLFISVNMFNSGNMIGNGFSIVTSTVSNYQAFSVPITYLTGNLIPDSSQIFFQIWKNSGQAFPGASYALIDGLSFDGLVQAVPVMDFSEKAAVNLFPNPVESNLSILIKNFHLLPGKIAEIQIIDITGRIIKTEMLNAKDLLQIDVSLLSPQLYFFKLSVEEKFIVTKFIKN